MQTSRTGFSQRRSEVTKMEHVPIMHASVMSTILKTNYPQEGG
jgi:hypothetical protein